MAHVRKLTNEDKPDKNLFPFELDMDDGPLILVAPTRKVGKLVGISPINNINMLLAGSR
jgi:hypothetical protein